MAGMDGKTPEPPYSNTGVERTDQNALIALVDWVQVTFKNARNCEKIAEFLGLKIGEFTDMETGLFRYRKRKIRGHISLLYDGIEAGMGVHVMMTGQGCREYEAENIMSWPEFFKKAFLEEAQFTRLDLAFDDFKGYFSVKQIIKKLDNGHTRSYFKSYRYMKKGKIADGSDRGLTVYLGSEKSDLQVRIYDKLLERQAAGKEIPENIKTWVRTEIELHDVRAMSAAQQIVYENESENATPIGTIISGTLANYINFLEENKNDSNKRRWKVWRNWREFLGKAARLKLTKIAPDRTIETRRGWIDRQTSKTLGKLFLAYNSDLDWLIDTLNKGMEMLEDKDFNEIDTYKRNQKLMDKVIRQIKEEGLLHDLEDKLDRQHKTLADFQYNWEAYTEYYQTLHKRIAEEKERIDKMREKSLKEGLFNDWLDD